MIIQLTILDEIEARFTNMTELNGYSENVGKIKRARLKPFKIGDLPALNYWPTSDVVIEKTGNKETHELGVTIEMHTLTRDEPFTDVSFKKGADIVTALFRSTTSPLVSDLPSYALGGLVNSVLVTGVTPTIGEGQSPWCGVLVDAVIQYNTNLGDVFNIINF